MTNSDRLNLIRQKLQAAFTPAFLEVKDDSHLHVGHIGAQQGGGHFTVTITSSHFANKSLIERHRLVYQVLEELIPKEIHALKIHAYAV